MVKWLNHVTIAAPRNGTNSHTVDPSSGTVVAGAAFTPTAGRLLVVCVEGAVTSTTPPGWTLPSGGEAVAITGLYLWYRTAAGSDTFTTTHNGLDHPVAFDIYEFPAGTTFLGAAAATNVSSAGGAGPSLGGLSAIADFRAAVVGQTVSNGLPLGSFTWSVGTEAVDTSTAYVGNDGYTYSLAYVEDAVDATWSSAATGANGGNTERIVFALNVPASAIEQAVDPAAVTLQGQQPTLIGSGESSSSTGTGGLTLAGQQPTFSGEGAAVVAVDEGGYALAGQQPTLEGSGAVGIPVDTAILSLSGVQPAFAGDTTLVSVDTAVLALEGQQAALSTDNPPIEVPVDPATLVLSGQQTAISGETTLVAVQPAVLDIFGVQAFLFDASVPPLPDDDVLLVLRVTNGDVILALSTGPDRDLEMR